MHFSIADRSTSCSLLKGSAHANHFDNYCLSSYRLQHKDNLLFSNCSFIQRVFPPYTSLSLRSWIQCVNKQGERFNETSSIDANEKIQQRDSEAFVATYIEWWSKCHIDSGSLIHGRPISLSLSTASLEVRSDAE